MHASKVEILDRRVAFKGYLRIDAYQLRHRLFGGGWSAPLSREVLERGRVVAVLLYDPDRDAVVLVRQFRIGALAAGMGPWVTEIVAGVIEAGESASDVAHRETREEAGLAVGELVPIYEYLVSPGCSTETVTMFCGRVDSRGAGGIHGHAGEHEDIEVTVVSAADAFAALADGRIANSIGIIALQWLALNREALRRRWRGPGEPSA